jgi:hypothetical protein
MAVVVLPVSGEAVLQRLCGVSLRSTNAMRATGFALLTYPFQHRFSCTGFQAGFLFRQIHAICSGSEGRVNDILMSIALRQSRIQVFLLYAVIAARLAVVALYVRGDLPQQAFPHHATDTY